MASDFTFKPVVLVSGQDSLTYSMVPWDSEIFGFGIAEVLSIEVAAPDSCRELIDRFEAVMRKQDVKMICVKVPAASREVIDLLQDSGFRFMEETLSPNIKDLQHPAVDFCTFPGYPLQKAVEQDLPAIASIARTTFANDRFHMDRHFNPVQAGERYARWVYNSYASGEEVLCCRINGRIVGFSIVRVNGDNAHLALIGIDDTWKGSGNGTRLLSSTCLHMKKKGARTMTTSMSLNNLQALNLYSRLGFRFKDPVYVFHKFLR